MAQITPTYNTGEMLSGQQLEPQAGFVAPFIEIVVPYYADASGALITGYEGDDFCEITPLDAHSARVRLYNVEEIDEILAGTNIIVPTTIPRIDLPAVLNSINAVYNTATGSGTDSHPASQQLILLFGTGSGALTPSSSSQGSAAITPDLQIDITERYLVNVSAMEYTFYLPSGSTMADVITKLVSLGATGVQAWPQFRPVSHTITLKGQQASVSAKADTSSGGGGSVDSGQVAYQWGNGTSSEVGITTITKTIPPTIHGVINISGGTTSSATASASADASTPTFTAVGTVISPISNTVSVSQNATATVTPTSLPATTPSAIPSSGLYIYSLNPGPSEFGQIIFQAIVVDFSTL